MVSVAPNAASRSSGGASTPWPLRPRHQFGEDSRLPVDQCAVAVEAQRLEPCEVVHPANLESARDRGRSDLGLPHPGRPRRRPARPDDRRPGGADLPDDELRVRGRRRRRRPVRPAEVRQHLQPGSATRPSPRSRSAWPASRAGIGAVATASGQSAELLVVRRAVRRRRPHRVVGPAVRRHAHAARVLAGPLRRRRPRSSRPATRPTTPPPSAAHPADPHRGRRQPVGRRRRSRGPRRRRPRRRRPARRRQHGGHAVPLPADGVRRRHRRPLGDEVPRRPRQLARRRGRRVRPLRLGQRPLPADDRAGRLVRRADAGGATSPSTRFCTRLRAEQLRDLGPALSPFNAFLLLQGLETLPQRMDAHLANARRSPSSWPGTRRCRGCAGPACPTTPTTSGPSATCRSGPGAVLSFGVRGGRDAGAAASIESVELCSHLANIGDARTLSSTRRARPTSSCPTTRSSPPACRPTWSASRSASRTPTTSSGTSTRRSPRPRKGG